MTRIDDLIAERCPSGVEFKPLGRLGKRNKGTPITAAKMKTLALQAGPVRVFAGGRTIADVPENAVPGKDIVRMPSIIVKSRGHIGFTYYDRPFTHKSELWSYSIDHPDVEQMFVYYYLLTQVTSLQDVARATSVKLPQLSVKDTDSLRIPVPPLEVQREIVRILDQFTQLASELEAELECRRAQRDALSNNLAVALRDTPGGSRQQERVPLGSICRESIEPVKLRDDDTYLSLGVKWNGEGVLARDRRSGASIKARTLYRARPGQLIYNRMFVVEGSFALVPAECDDAVVSGEFPLFDIDTSRVEPEWLLHHLCDPHTLKLIEREVTGTERGSMKSRRRWKSHQFRQFEISLPSLAMQQDIVKVLRSGEALIRALEDEIAARRKQYEHYRDKLLTFKEAPA